MEIVSKITEPKLVWEIFTYVAESPLTKEKRKQIEEWRGIWSEKTGKYLPFPEFIGYSVKDKAFYFEDAKDNREYDEPNPLCIILKLFENQEYDWTQQSSVQIDKDLFDKWDRDNGNGFNFWITLCARRSFDVGVKLQLDYDIIPPRYWGLAEEEYIKEYNRLF